MERRSYGFFTKRSQHYDNLQAEQQQLQKQPLKDATNTAGIGHKAAKVNNNDEDEPQTAQSPLPIVHQQPAGIVQPQQQQQQQQQQPHPQAQQPQEGSRSLQCLETLAQKAGIFDITAEDCKYDAATTLLNLERGQHISMSVNELNNKSQMDQNQQQQQGAAQQAQQQQAAVQQASQQQQQQVVQQQVVQQQQIQQVQMQPDQTMVPAQSPQHIQQIAAVSTGGAQLQTSSMGPPQHTVSMHQQVAQGGQVIQTQGGQLVAAGSNNTTITTMSPLQQAPPGHTQQMADWGHGRVQVIQQPIQNQFMPQIYNAQGQLIMPGNIQLHPSINPQQIQVIAKPFQGNQLAPHMITTAQGKQVIQASQAATFPYTIPTTQNQQTLVFSQLAIGSQPNVIHNSSAGTAGTAVNQQKTPEIHKVQMQGQKVQMQKVAGNVQTVATAQQQPGQCVQVSQAMIGSQPTAQIISQIQPNGQQMQFAATPWPFAANSIPQVWTTNGLQSGLITQNPIFIRNTQPDGTPGGMFIQQNPQPATIQAQQNPTAAATITTQGIQQLGKPRPAVVDNIQPKQQTPTRPLILPSNAQTIRPASSVSTQTGAQNQALIGAKITTKVRAKTPGIRTSPAPKADAANQTLAKPYNQTLQQHNVVNSKMLVMNTSTGGITMAPGSPMTAEKAQQLVASQQKQQQVVQPGQPQPTQQVIMQHPIQQQQAAAALQQMQFQAGQAQHIQPKMMTMQAIPQQMQVQGDRPIMPVVSMSAQPTAQVQQTMQSMQQLQGTIHPLQPNLAVTQQPMQMNIQQLHQQLPQMTPQGAIIGQLHTTPTGINQVQTTATPQIQQLTAQPGQQTITIATAPATAPQQIPLPASVPQVKTETGVEAISADSSAEPPKENGVEAIQPKPEPLSAEVKPLINGVEVNPTVSIPPTPIPGTVPTSVVPVSTTNENGLPIAATAEEVKERCPPKAMVKPQVLTHVIEDFVIQESSEPFPITRSSLMGEYNKHSAKEHPDEPLKKKHVSEEMVESAKGGEYAKCENCGVVDLKAKFKKNKRFCSIACSKSSKQKDGKKKDKDESMEVDVESVEGVESTLSPTGSTQAAVEDSTPKVDPLKWSVQEVYDFIRNLPGCSDYAEDFQIQEIDGQALMLLKADHLMTAMNMKLGPALKIVAKIDDMRIDKEPPKQA